MLIGLGGDRPLHELARLAHGAAGPWGPGTEIVAACGLRLGPAEIGASAPAGQLTCGRCRSTRPLPRRCAACGREVDPGARLCPTDLAEFARTLAAARPGPDRARLAALRAELWVLWRERAAELGRPEPAELGGACKFAALLAQGALGGRIRANWHHTWLELDGAIIDLTDAAGLAAHVDPHAPDPLFERDPEFAASLASCRGRVARHLARLGSSGTPPVARGASSARVRA